MYSDVLNTLNVVLPESLLAGKCREEHIPEISLKFKWRVAAPFLHLDEQQMEDIQAEARLEQERRVKTLRVWVQTFGEAATYGRLMRGLIRARLKEQALNVALVLLRLQRPMALQRGRLASDSEYKCNPLSCAVASYHVVN